MRKGGGEKLFFLSFFQLQNPIIGDFNFLRCAVHYAILLLVGTSFGVCVNVCVCVCVRERVCVCVCVCVCV